jgi:hypothetical protein
LPQLSSGPLASQTEVDTLKMPQRDTGLWFTIDTNRINARQNDKLMNQLEDWEAKNVIGLYITELVANEAAKGNSIQRRRKVERYGLKLEPLAETPDEKKDLNEISEILFDRQPLNENERNDVLIVFCAKKYFNLITEDGDSKTQPNGILGKREELRRRLHINVYRTNEAVLLIRKQIHLRDENAKYASRVNREPLPDWVGKD